MDVIWAAALSSMLFLGQHTCTQQQFLFLRAVCCSVLLASSQVGSLLCLVLAAATTLGMQRYACFINHLQFSFSICISRVSNPFVFFACYFLFFTGKHVVTNSSSAASLYRLPANRPVSRPVNVGWLPLIGRVDDKVVIHSSTYHK